MKYFFCASAVGFLFITMPVFSMDQKGHWDPDISLFKQKTLTNLTVEQTIPDNCPNKQGAIKLLKSRPLTAVKTTDEPDIKKEVGFTFPSSAPWCLLAAQYIKSLGFRPNLGDWGCGHGFFSSHAVISGANPYAIDSSLPAATEANKTIFRTAPYIPTGLDIKSLYKATHVSVVNPGDPFMKRKNHINVAFNVIHYLSPSDADRFLTNFYTKTLEGGIGILSCDTPFDVNGKYDKYYNKGVEEGIKYPGYGVYSRSTIIKLNDINKKLYLSRHVCRLTAEEEKSEKFKMGQQYKGIYPLVPDYDNGQTVHVDQLAPQRDIIGNTDQAYRYATTHQLFNKFDFDGLKKVLEHTGFTVINGWYTNHSLDILYPHDDANVKNELKSKLVIVVQKQQKTID